MPSKINNTTHQYRQWLIKAPLGLVIIGFGASLIAEAAMLKFGGAATLNWVTYGTIALVVFNSGLCVLGDAVKHRSHYERLKEE